jgi:DHA1 family tetracycline resistance protein-like MFS transporter
MPRGSKLSPLGAIFLTVFLDMMAFGMFIPDIQLRGESLGAHKETLGLLLASFSIAQFLTAPLLGRLSDRVGRRIVLIITCALGAACFFTYAHANTLGWMFVSRILAGVSGANIGVAFAYVADVTTPENRAKGLGVVGAAFGLGFIFGPPLGSQLIKWGHGEPLLIGYVAMVLALVNLIYVALVLHEPERTSPPERSHPYADLARALKTPGLSLLIVMFFIANFGFSNLESTFFRLMIEHFGASQENGAFFLAWVGIIMAFTNGYLIRIVQPKIGEVRMLRYGWLMTAPTLALIPFLPLWTPMMIGAIFLGVGQGFANPALSSLISRSAPRDMQGGLFGITQSAGALARIAGPMVGSSLFDRVSPAAPYLVAGAVTALPLLAAWRLVAPPEHQGDEAATVIH